MEFPARAGVLSPALPGGVVHFGRTIVSAKAARLQLGMRAHHGRCSVTVTTAASACLCNAL